jgi:glucose/arabinose dehydrogenase
MKRLALVVGLAVLAAPGSAAAERLERVGTFRSPVHVTAPPADKARLFVVERRGRIRIMRRGRVLRRPFLDISRLVHMRTRDVTADHGGLLSLEFAPDYRTSGRFYISYTTRGGLLRLVEYRRSTSDRNRAAPSTARTLFSVRRFRFNVGGHMEFGPDGLLYAGLGDGDGSAQDPDSLLGKIVRFDPTESPVSPDVYVMGLKNPWRFSFSPRRHLLIGDVGETLAEEINLVPRGSAPGTNLGWDVFEGRRRIESGAVPRLVHPLISLPHRRGYCAIIGGHVVRDRSLRRLRGRYVYTDLCFGSIRSARVRPGRVAGHRRERLAVSYPVSFGMDARGRTYLVSLDGGVFRLAPG